MTFLDPYLWNITITDIAMKRCIMVTILNFFVPTPSNKRGASTFKLLLYFQLKDPVLFQNCFINSFLKHWNVLFILWNIFNNQIIFIGVSQLRRALEQIGFCFQIKEEANTFKWNMETLVLTNCNWIKKLCLIVD